LSFRSQNIKDPLELPVANSGLADLLKLRHIAGSFCFNSKMICAVRRLITRIDPVDSATATTSMTGDVSTAVIYARPRSLKMLSLKENIFLEELKFHN
jgi:hypothetical protein